MFFRQLYDIESSTLTYIIADLESTETLIIDPVSTEIETYKSILMQYGLILKYSLETHIHADHITASGQLRKSLNCKTAISQFCDSKLADIQIKEGDRFQLGDNETISTIVTPGHTIGSTSFLWRDRVFTGDSLLINGCGRTDFQGGDAGDQYHSITQKLFKLPDETLVYPGHDYKGFRVSSVLQEKLNNPRLANKSRDDFIIMMNNLDLPKPKLIDIAVPANLYCGIDDHGAIQASDVALGIETGRLLTSSQLVAQIKTEITEALPSEVALMLDEENTVLIDIREPSEYESGSIARAHFLPRGVLEFKIMDLDDIINPQNKIILFCRSGNRSALAAASLDKMGFSNVISMIGGYEAWKESIAI